MHYDQFQLCIKAWVQHGITDFQSVVAPAWFFIFFLFVCFCFLFFYIFIYLLGGLKGARYFSGGQFSKTLQKKSSVLTTLYRKMAVFSWFYSNLGEGANWGERQIFFLGGVMPHLAFPSGITDYLLAKECSELQQQVIQHINYKAYCTPGMYGPGQVGKGLCSNWPITYLSQVWFLHPTADPPFHLILSPP